MSLRVCSGDKMFEEIIKVQDSLLVLFLCSCETLNRKALRLNVLEMLGHLGAFKVWVSTLNIGPEFKILPFYFSSCVNWANSLTSLGLIYKMEIVIRLKLKC